MEVKIEILHTKIKKVFASNTESDPKVFQKMTEDEILANGFVYVRDYKEPFDPLNDPIFMIEKEYEGQDSKGIKKKMKAAAKAIGYNKLNNEQVKKLTEYKAIPVSESIKKLSIDEIVELEVNKKDCSKNWEKAFCLLSSVVPISELMPVIESINQLIENYKNYGIQGVGYFNYGDDEDPEGILNFIKSDSTFIGKGLKESAINPKFNVSKQELVNKLLKIL